MSIITKILSSGVGDVIEKIGGVVDKFVTTSKEKEEMKREMLTIVNIHEEKMNELLNSQIDSYLKDTDSARNMQVEALKQPDKFAKRFIYYLTVIYLLFCFSFILCLFWVKYPESNRDLINMCAGVVISTGLISIITFFYGSSAGSKEKSQTIDKIINK